MGIITALASGPAKRWTVLISGGAYAFTAVAVLLPRPWRPPASGCRTSGPAAVICDAAGGEPLALAALAVLAAERAGPLSREVAGWCVQDGALEEAVGTLERGRALALRTEMATVDVLSTLSRLGRADLAGEWRGWRDSARRRSEAGHRPDGTVTRPGTAPGDGALLLLGLTGAQARISSSRALHRLYSRPRLLAPEAGRPSARPDRGPDGTTRPAEVLDDPAGRSLARHRGHLGAPAARSVGQLALAPRLRRGPRPGRDADRGHRPSVRADRGGAAVPRAAGRARAVCLPGLVHERPAAPPPGRVVHHGGGVPGRGSVVRAGLVVAGEAARDGPRRPPVPPRAPYGPRTGGRAAPGATLDGRPGPGAARVDAGRRTAARGRTADALTASRHDPADPAFWAGLVVVGR